MPSPFRGMDPFLESELWTSVHFALSAEIVRQLAPRVQPKYLVLPVERMIMAMPEDIGVALADAYPDASVVEQAGGPTLGTEASGAPALVAPIRLATVVPSSIPHVTVEIRDAAGRQLVTAIEVLSPTNKRGAGREEYLAKRARLLLSQAHLVEIDLLRRGQRVPLRDPLPPASYYVLVSRAETRPLADVWPIALGQPLPVVPIPLLPGDPDVPLDLQAVLTTAYDQLRLDLAVNYDQPPDVPLTQDEAAWADRLLATWRATRAGG